ncbi:MAG: ABC transporter ATP-binding protein [Euryarchaeota archaeon]|nr:ABC transporter ATP-binding protein [Euryarchaeota archaeon]
MILARGLTKVYRMGAEEVHALRGVDLAVEKGEVVAVVGASGSGKSTLLHILGGLDAPTAGSVYLDGQEITSLSEDELAELRARKIGFVFQFHNLLPALTALENVELPMVFTGIKPRQRRRRALELLQQVGLEDRLSHTPLQLSGGQQQRVAIARALANRPAVVLADEPTGELDSANSLRVMQTFLELREEHGVTVVLATHDLEIAKLADRTVKLKDGIILERGA